jgi:hypothetical protein
VVERMFKAIYHTYTIYIHTYIPMHEEASNYQKYLCYYLKQDIEWLYNKQGETENSVLKLGNCFWQEKSSILTFLTLFFKNYQTLTLLQPTCKSLISCKLFQRTLPHPLAPLPYRKSREIWFRNYNYIQSCYGNWCFCFSLIKTEQQGNLQLQWNSTLWSIYSPNIIILVLFVQVLILCFYFLKSTLPVGVFISWLNILCNKIK